jgi:hypothetical protein
VSGEDDDFAHLFDGVDRQWSGDVYANVTPKPLTLEDIERAMQLVEERAPVPWEEIHHPRCPKITSRGERACRCGSAPTEAAFEDELAATGRR